MTAQAEEVVESFSSVTAIVFAVISLAIYMLFLRPTTVATTTATTAAGGTPRAAARPATPRQPRAMTPRHNQNHPQNSMNHHLPADQQQLRPRSNQNNHPLYLSEAAAEMLVANRSTPSHVSTTAEKVGIGGTSILVDGMVAFSHTRAFACSQTNKSDPTVRQDRAKILSRILSSSNAASSSGMTQPPPSKGSTVVIALKQSDLLSTQTSSSLSRSLYLLATYCNLLVVLAVEPNSTTTTNNNNDVDKEALLSELRKDDVLTEQVLPSHRILLASTTTGRIALVQQLSNNQVGLVVDWDPDVKT
jgi:hypothetical protein